MNLKLMLASAMVLLTVVFSGCAFYGSTAIGIQITMIITIADTLTAVTTPILTMVTRLIITVTGMGN